jgi:hypothetical protein
MLSDHRIRIVIGNYGTGKTEFSVNYALRLAAGGHKTALVDLDVVNLYFRSREKQEELEAAGVRVISSSVKGRAVDLPAVPAEAVTPLQHKSYETILDVGGDQMGARTLKRYEAYFTPGQYDMFFVVNANRPETQDLAGVMAHMEAIERVSGIKITALVNNTHMVRQTSIDDVLRGQSLCQEISEHTGLPIRYVCALKALIPKLPHDLKGEVFPISLIMREPWMS